MDLVPFPLGLSFRFGIFLRWTPLFKGSSFPPLHYYFFFLKVIFKTHQFFEFCLTLLFLLFSSQIPLILFFTCSALALDNALLTTLLVPSSTFLVFASVVLSLATACSTHYLLCLCSPHFCSSLAAPPCPHIPYTLLYLATCLCLCASSMLRSNLTRAPTKPCSPCRMVPSLLRTLVTRRFGQIRATRCRASLDGPPAQGCAYRSNVACNNTSQ